MSLTFGDGVLVAALGWICLLALAIWSVRHEPALPSEQRAAQGGRQTIARRDRRRVGARAFPFAPKRRRSMPARSRTRA